ncbi:MAG: hypothetical protein Q7J98_10745 [Kiritimatiellia bacterium]|nr:hypothetical protein [Kiritimatiellia bacterium]
MLVLLTIKLKKIIYSGENIGNDLIFQFNVQRQVAQVKTGISSGQHKSFDKVLFQGTFTESSARLPIRVNITEKDPVFPDTGSGSSRFNVQLQGPETQTHSFNANVIASGGDQGKIAAFTFIMEANVVKALKVDISTTDANPRTTTSQAPFDINNLFLDEGDLVKFTATAIANLVYGWSVEPENHGNFNPNNVRQNTTSFTPSSRNIEPVLPLTTIILSLDSDEKVYVQEARIVEQRAIRMLMQEARDSRISEVERQGLLWVAKNRINDSRFLGAGSLNGVLQEGFEDFPAAQTRGTLPDFRTKKEYDKITDIAGKVLSGQFADNTAGSIAFVTPSANDLVIIRKAIDSNSASSAKDIGLKIIPALPAIPELQIVLINGLRPFNSASRPFIFFREKTDPNSLTVFDLRGGQ